MNNNTGNRLTAIPIVSYYHIVNSYYYCAITLKLSCNYNVFLAQLVSQLSLVITLPCGCGIVVAVVIVLVVSIVCDLFSSLFCKLRLATILVIESSNFTHVCTHVI